MTVIREIRYRFEPTRPLIRIGFSVEATIDHGEITVPPTATGTFAGLSMLSPVPAPGLNVPGFNGSSIGTVKTLLMLMKPGFASFREIAPYGGSPNAGAPVPPVGLADMTEMRVNSGVVSVPARFS